MHENKVFVFLSTFISFSSRRTVSRGHAIACGCCCSSSARSSVKKVIAACAQQNARKLSLDKMHSIEFISTPDLYLLEASCMSHFTPPFNVQSCNHGPPISREYVSLIIYYEPDHTRDTKHQRQWICSSVNWCFDERTGSSNDREFVFAVPTLVSVVLQRSLKAKPTGKKAKSRYIFLP